VSQPITTKDFEKIQTLPVAWNGSMCDDCGVIAVYTATKDSFELNFCGHHLRKHAEKLTSDGFKINPDFYQL
jgi:hypothetical protein